MAVTATGYTMSFALTSTVLTMLMMIMIATTSATFYSNHVFGGEHLDDNIMTSNGSNKSDKNAVLVLYNPSCLDKIIQLGISAHGLPPWHHVVFLEHDYVTSRENTWYRWNENEDLRKRYKPKKCPTVIYIPKGSALYQEASHFQQWSLGTGPNFQEWIWDMFEKRVTVWNDRPDGSVTIGVRSTAPGTRNSEVILEAGKSRRLHIHVSDMVYALIKPESSFLNGWVISEDTSDLRLADYSRGGVSHDGHGGEDTGIKSTLHAWLRTAGEAEYSKSDNMVRWLQSHAQRHLLNRKQPLLSPRFTENGFKRSAIPTALYNLMLEFYQTNRNENLSLERWSRDSSYINQDKVRCTMVQISEEVKAEIERVLQPIMEEWCGCTLEPTATYGIRQYHHGNFLKNHVDRFDTHVISAILQISRDLGGNKDWALEVVERSGQKQQINLEPGSMLLYESTSLIHGRPEPFQGNVYANVFTHFKPATGWTYHYNNDQLEYNGVAEPLFPLEGDITKSLRKTKEAMRKKDEL